MVLDTVVNMLSYSSQIDVASIAGRANASATLRGRQHDTTGPGSPELRSEPAFANIGENTWQLLAIIGNKVGAAAYNH